MRPRRRPGLPPGTGQVPTWSTGRRAGLGRVGVTTALGRDDEGLEEAVEGVARAREPRRPAGRCSGPRAPVVPGPGSSACAVERVGRPAPPRRRRHVVEPGRVRGRGAQTGRRGVRGSVGRPTRRASPQGPCAAPPSPEPGPEAGPIAPHRAVGPPAVKLTVHRRGPSSTVRPPEQAQAEVGQEA